MLGRGLRTRLTLTYTIALFVGLVAFAVLADALLDRTFEIGLDQSLRQCARGIAAISDNSENAFAFDAGDRSQIAQIIGTKLDGAIVTKDGNVAASSATAVPPEILALATRAGEPARLTTVIVSGQNDAVRVAAEPLVRNGQTVGYALAWRSADPTEEIDRPAMLAFLVTIPVIVILAALAGGAIAQRGLKPLAAMADIASDIEAHDLSRRLHAPPTDDELGRLCATFDRMLDRLAGAFERQRRFTADASHELRAPLSVIRAEADLALRKPRDGPEYRRALASIAAESDRLQVLIGDLLAVARADERTSEARVPVDVGDLARAAARRLTPVAQTKSVALVSDVAGAHTVLGDYDAIARVPVVLLDNAVKYAPYGGHVSISVGREDGSVVMLVKDDGPGFSPSGLNQATHRFWRDDAARSRGGSGLGLAIARAIVEQAGGSLEIANSAGGGAMITVRLPAA